MTDFVISIVTPGFRMCGRASVSRPRLAVRLSRFCNGILLLSVLFLLATYTCKKRLWKGMKISYRRGGVPRYIEKPNKTAVEKARINPPTHTLLMLGPIT